VDGVSWLARFGEINNEKINPLFISGCLFFRYLRYRPPSAVRWHRLLCLANGGQANIAVSNTDPNLFTVPGDRITAINSLDGGLTNQEQTDSGGAILPRSARNRSRLLWKPSAA
jgi:conjugal transfer pilus assembly protein TraK